jgi:hypothetical protein
MVMVVLANTNGVANCNNIALAATAVINCFLKFIIFHPLSLCIFPLILKGLHFPPFGLTSKKNGGLLSSFLNKKPPFAVSLVIKS